jgi:succinate-acetate transporter protein
MFWLFILLSVLCAVLAIGALTTNHVLLGCTMLIMALWSLYMNRETAKTIDETQAEMDNMRKK